MNIFSTSFNYEARLEKVRKLMDQRDIDAILVHLWPNQYYLSGFYPHLPWYPVQVRFSTETPLVVFRDRGQEPIYFAAWTTSNSLAEGTWIKDIRVIDKEPYGKSGWWQYLAEALKEKGVDEGHIGIEEEVCVISTFKKLKAALPKAQFTDITDIFQDVRTIKEPEEIKLIKESVLIAEAGLAAGIEAAKVGVLESEVQKTSEIEMKRLGAIREVETMCQSGARTATHRAFGTNWKKIEPNDLVCIDIGCVYKGYGSDITRTWVVGQPNDAQNKMASDLARIHEKILKLMKPGVTSDQVYELGKNELRAAGYSTSKYAWPNGGGEGRVGFHGVGLGPFHDPPHDMGSKPITIQPGMVLAVSGDVRHAQFTIRYEDDVVVVPHGIELINRRFPWSLTIK